MKSQSEHNMLSLVLLMFVGLYCSLNIWAQDPQNYFRDEIYTLLKQVDSLELDQKPDSAIIIGNLAVNKAKAKFGQFDTTSADAINRLGISYFYMGNYDNVSLLWIEALEIRESVLGSEHPKVAASLSNLGVLFDEKGEYYEAEKYLKKSLIINEKILGSEDPELSYALLGLGNLYEHMNKYSDAISAYNRALALIDAGPESNHPNISKALNGLANIYANEDKFDDALKLYERALEFDENIFGPDHPEVAITLSNMAVISWEMGRLAKAEYFLKRGLDMMIKFLGPNHPDIAKGINNLGVLYYDQGKYEEAEKLLKEALMSRENILGNAHFDVVYSLNYLARTYISAGKLNECPDIFKRLLGAQQRFIENIFSCTSENQKYAYIEKYPMEVDVVINYALTANNRVSNILALEMILHGKALIIDAICDEKETIFYSSDSNLAIDTEEYSEICGKIAAMSLADISQVDFTDYRDSLNCLYRLKDSLEIELSRACSEFKDELAERRFEVEDIVNALPEGGVLWEILQYGPYDFQKTGNKKERTRPARYLAISLVHSGEITLTDLGGVTEIDSLVTLARKMIYNAGSDIHSVGNVIAESRLNEVTGRLYDLILAPLEFLLNDRTRIFISPDGQLSLLPFEIFPDGDGKYVIEKYNISYLSSGRDLLKFKKKPKYGNWALAMAAPDFDLSRATLTERRDQALRKSEYTAFVYEPSRGASGCLNARFDLLPYTKKETKSVVKTLKKKTKLDVDAYYGDQALEEVLKSMTIPPRVLHLSTHGYFCEDIDLTENRILENPLLRSGLAFAGANRLMTETGEDTSQVEDGILTAFEVSGLNLIGTELVTLSACETGLGEVKNGEGVFGLRRAFQHAGARTILMSLWKVPDKETYKLMDNFYKNWLGGQTKQEALRQAALKVLNDRRNKHGAAHPYYWGAFVMLGDPK